MSLKNFRITLTTLCVVLGAIGYGLLFDVESALDELILILSTSFAIILHFSVKHLIEIPISNLIQSTKTAAQSESGEQINLIKIKEYNELSKWLNFILRIFKESILYVREIENNNLDFEIELSDEHALKKSLHNMQQQMIQINEEATQRQWINEGLSQFVDILRSSEGNIIGLGRNIISHLVKYTKSSQAGLYIFDEHKENLKQIAFYAYNRDKFSAELIPRGFGLLWQCLFEKKPIHLTEIPKDYVRITSGLGGARPNSVLIIPLLLEEDTFGVLELASFSRYQKFEVEFIQRLAENISSTIASAETNEKTKKLLDESEIKTRELQEQEQQMRQNMEEMQSTQEEMQRIQKEILHKDYNIKALLDTSNDTFFAINLEYKIIVVNRALKEKYIRNGIDLKEGDNIFDCIPPEQHKVWKARYDRCFNGENYTQEIESSNELGELVYLRGYYSCIKDNAGEVIGASVRSTDISEINNYNLEIMELNKTIMNMKDEMEKNAKSVENFLKSESMGKNPKLTRARNELRALIGKNKEGDDDDV